MALTHCEVCEQLLSKCKCKSTPADFIEAQPDDIIANVIKIIKKWGKK